MASFLYFLPGHSAPVTSVEKIPDSAAELKQTIRDARVQMGHCTGGPGGKSGAIIVPVPASKDGKAADAVYAPERQTWRAWPNEESPAYWVGVENANRPGPADVARKDAPEGHLVKLGDGKEWLIPSVCVDRPERCTLTQSIQFDDSGNISLRATDADAEIIREGQKWFEIVSTGSSFLFGDYAFWALRLIGIGYRLGRPEISMLELLLNREDQKADVIFASIGYVDILAQLRAEKKMPSPPPAT